MTANMITTVVFGYVIDLTYDQAQLLENNSKNGLTLIKSIKDQYIFGVVLLNKKYLDPIGSISLTEIDFAANERDIQEQLSSINVSVDHRAEILVMN